MASDLKIKVSEPVGATNWAKCKWKMNMQFKQYDIMSIMDGSRKRPNITNTEMRRKIIKKFVGVEAG